MAFTKYSEISSIIKTIMYMQHIPVYTSILITLKSYFSVWTYGSIAICTNILYMYCDIFWGWLDNNKTKAFAHPYKPMDACLKLWCSSKWWTDLSLSLITYQIMFPFRIQRTKLHRHCVKDLNNKTRRFLVSY